MLDDLEISLPKSGGVALYPPGATFGPRRMREWEFVWLMEGHAVYHWNDRIVEAPDGAIVLCRPDATDSFVWDPRRETRHAYFHFEVTRLPEDWAIGDWPLARTGMEGDILVPLFRFLLTRLNRGDPDQVRLAMASMLLGFRTGDRATSLSGQPARATTVTITCDYIRRRLEAEPSQALSLNELADAAHVTPEHLCRLFQAALGVSPAKVVLRTRLDRAAGLLTHSNYSIGEIAEMCGFANPFHFSRRFKEAFGQSPSEVRINVRRGEIPLLPTLIS